MKLPPGEDLNEWIAVNGKSNLFFFLLDNLSVVLDFYNQINLIYGSITGMLNFLLSNLVSFNLFAHFFNRILYQIAVLLCLRVQSKPFLIFLFSQKIGTNICSRWS